MLWQRYPDSQVLTPMVVWFYFILTHTNMILKLEGIEKAWESSKYWIVHTKKLSTIAPCHTLLTVRSLGWWREFPWPSVAPPGPSPGSRGCPARPCWRRERWCRPSGSWSWIWALGTTLGPCAGRWRTVELLLYSPEHSCPHGETVGYCVAGKCAQYRNIDKHCLLLWLHLLNSSCPTFKNSLAV